MENLESCLTMFSVLQYPACMFHFPKILIEIFNVFAGIEFSWSRFEKRFVGIKSMWMKTATQISFLVALIAILGFF